MGKGSEKSREPFAPPTPLVGIENAHVQPAPVLVRRAQRGDAMALADVMEDLLRYLAPICGSIALERGDDALQDAMVAVMANLGSLREPAALRGWARRIAVREAVRAAGGDASTPVDPEVLASVAPATADEGMAVDVRAVLETLAPEQRAVLVLRHLTGAGEAEMAGRLNVAPGTVKSRLSRARAAFRARWSS